MLYTKRRLISIKESPGVSLHDLGRWLQRRFVERCRHGNSSLSDFIVTLGQWGGGTGGTDDEKVGTFIHELGHTLGLTHGGSDHVNFKPNPHQRHELFFPDSGDQVESRSQFIGDYHCRRFGKTFCLNQTVWVQGAS
ncbi:MAG: M66 family metalloprotease [Planctomycetaceae bacterium]